MANETGKPAEMRKTLMRQMFENIFSKGFEILSYVGEGKNILNVPTLIL
jgi:hypothetical protein